MREARGAQIIKLTISIVVCHLAGIIGALFTRPAVSTWYATLAKPFFTPPDWVFAPVWMALYTLMGIAAFLAWQKGVNQKQNQFAFILFGIQWTLNALWPLAFFGLKSPLTGLVEISLLAFMILLTIQRFLKISKAAGILLIPYFLWVAFASGLNLSIWVLNR